MPRVEVKSAVVRALDYDERTQEMTVDFNETGPHVYSGVPQATYYQLANAPSVGRYLNQYVRGRYPSRKA